MVELMVVIYVLGIFFYLGVFYAELLEGAAALPSRTWCRLLFWAYLLMVCLTWPVSTAFSAGVSLAKARSQHRKATGEELDEASS